MLGNVSGRWRTLAPPQPVIGRRRRVAAAARLGTGVGHTTSGSRC